MLSAYRYKQAQKLQMAEIFNLQHYNLADHFTNQLFFYYPSTQKQFELSRGRNIDWKTAKYPCGAQ